MNEPGKIEETFMLASGSLLLDHEGKRQVCVSGPVIITRDELARIQSWIGFHFIVEDPKVKPLEPLLVRGRTDGFKE